MLLADDQTIMQKNNCTSNYLFTSEIYYVRIVTIFTSKTKVIAFKKIY